jgi:CRP/FNR family cyclic AMP-dependent transcriptional regulator
MRKNRKASFDPKMFLAKVGGGKTIAKYQKDQIVFSQGDVADAVFYVQEGKLKVTVISEQGKEAVVAILGPGDFFGEGSLNGHALRVATTSAMAECVVTRIAKNSMIATLHKKPEFSELQLLGTDARTQKDPTGKAFGIELYAAGQKPEGQITEVSYLFVRPGPDTKPVPKVSFVTRAGDIYCGVGYYK